MQFNNLDTEILGGLSSSRKRNGRVRVIWLGLLGRPSMSVRGGRGTSGQPAKHKKKHTVKNEWLQCTGFGQNHHLAPRWLRSSPLRFSYHGPIAIASALGTHNINSTEGS